MIESWLFPCSIKQFDLIEHFKKNTTVVWRKSFSVCLNDIVYIYMSMPYQEIMFKCHVINDNVSQELVEQNLYAKRADYYDGRKSKYIQLQLDFEYPRGIMTYEVMKQIGISKIQSQRRADKKFLDYINRVNHQLCI